MRHSGAGAPAHRWTATVLTLMALASLPTVAAVSVGSATLGDVGPPTGTTPFIAQPAGSLYVVVIGPPVGSHSRDLPGRRPPPRCGHPGR